MEGKPRVWLKETNTANLQEILKKKMNSVALQVTTGVIICGAFLSQRVTY